METSPRNASHLPSIKCSTCGQDINLAAIADHICSALPAASSSSSTAGPFPSPSKSSAVFPPREASFLKPQRPALPKIDSSVAVPVPFAGELTPASSGNGSVGSPVSATSGRRSPWRAPSRRPTIIISQGPPSPELVNLDCAFPPFPTMPSTKTSSKDDRSLKTRGDKSAKGRSTSPASSARSSKQFRGPSPLSRTTSNGSGRLRSKSMSGESRLRRPSMSASNRQPSGRSTGSRKPSTEDVPPMPVPSPDLGIRPPPPAPLERAETAPLVSTKKNVSTEALNDLHRYTTADGVVHEEPQPIDPGTGANTTQGPEVVLTSPFPLAQPMKEEPAYKSKRPPPIVSSIPLSQRGQISKARSPTVPPPTSSNSLSRSLTKLFGRRRSQSASSRRDIARTALSDDLEDAPPTPPVPQSAIEALHRPRLTPQSAPESATHPFSPLLPDSGTAEHKDSLDVLEKSDAGSAPPTIVRSEAESVSNVEAMRFDFDWHQLGPKASEAPASASIARRPTEAELRRASIDSASSYGSMGFDERTASSRSSAPPIEELARKMSDSVHLSPVQTSVVDTPSPLRPRNLEISADSPTDPLFIDGRLSPLPSEKPRAVEPPVISEITPPPPPPPPPPTQLPVLPATKDSLAIGSKPAAPNKGVCRGCSKTILPAQKSVSSADGRLSGRYHKECFVCWTCKSAFATAEFYVHADRPYCAHHYHEQDNSLCATCGKGIEGLYMETANVAGRGREKHHPHCLKCATCRVQLDNDYFELSGKVYCERDAFRLASLPKVHDRSPARPSPLVREYISSGDPGLLKGTNFPERRITRLMTTT